jgi:hypothetical protein
VFRIPIESFVTIPIDSVEVFRSYCVQLRGHGGDEAKALEKLRHAISYRMEIISMEPYASMRKAIGESQFVDIGLLPHAQEVLPVLPLCNIEGLSAGLPVVLTLLRFIDYSVFSELSTDSMAQFLRALLEQRALVLHNRSVSTRG